MPEAYKYPLLSALRAAVKVQGRGARWEADPFEVLADTGVQLTNIVGNAVRQTNNPNKVGKGIGVWSRWYLVVKSALQQTVTTVAEREIEQLKAQIAELKSGKQRA